MITDKDRKGYFGGSDAHYVTGNWNSKSFKNWWLVKLGLYKDDLETKAMKVGTAFEHMILQAFNPEMVMDEQIVFEDKKLRVNYDGCYKHHIYECKTYSAEEFKVSKNYWRQAQVEMFAYNEAHPEVESKLSILAYKVGEAEYLNYFTEIDHERILEFPIEYDEDYIKEYLQCLEVLCDCLKRGVMPNEDERPNRNKPKSKRASARKG